MIIRIAKIAALFIALILIIGASGYLTLTLMIKSEDTVIVPDLVGKDVVSVLKILTNLGLNTKVKGSEYSAEFPENHVVFQEPEPGAEIKKARDVRIILSKGAKTVFIPNLSGLSMQQARIILEENGLRQGKVSRTFSRAIENGDILSQFPAPGTVMPRGRSVDLLVSLGDRPRAYKMPDLTGLSMNEAIFLIENSDLSLGNIHPSFHKGMPKDVIAGQDPLSGARVLAGSAVDIVVNRKPDGNQSESGSGANGISLFRYRLENGFLKRRIRVTLSGFGTSTDLFDAYIKPGEEIWLLVPKIDDATLLLYVDEELVKTERG